MISQSDFNKAAVLGRAGKERNEPSAVAQRWTNLNVTSVRKPSLLVLCFVSCVNHNQTMRWLQKGEEKRESDG